MRSEQEMMELILRTAREDAQIRAVWLNGSRADPNAQRDRYMDFDVVYAVSAVEPYRSCAWLERFGEICVMQNPDLSPFFPPEADYVDGRRQTYLMQFMDGNRIDLTLLRLDEAEERYGAERQTVLLLSKDDRFQPFPATDRDYWLTPPTQAQFAACCNEFWWTAPYVAKGLARSVDNEGELLYARHMLEQVVRPEAERMLGWLAGVQKGWTLSPGKCMKRLPSLLPETVWQTYLQTFPDHTAASVRAALRRMCDLFAAVSVRVAEALGLVRDTREAGNSRNYIETLLRDSERG